MVNQYKIVFSLNGSEQNDMHLDLPVLLQKMKEFYGFLQSTAKETSEDVTAFRVTHISHNSPIEVACELTSKNQEGVNAVFQSVGKNLNSVIEEQTDHLTHAVLDKLEKLAKFNSHEIESAKIEMVNGTGKVRRYPLNNPFREALIKARRTEQICVSTVYGKLEQVNTHYKAKKFTIYPSLPHVPSVTCKFPDNLLDKVRNTLTEYVSVRGKCFYRPDKNFPHLIEVQEIKLVPHGENLPTLRDLYGIAPNITNGLSSEEFVRQQRDKWGR